MLDLKDYIPKEAFFRLRLNRRCCIVRIATGLEKYEDAIIIANAPCLVDSWEQRVTPIDTHVLVSAMQTFNVYLPRRWIHKETKEEIIIPYGYTHDWFASQIQGPAPQDVVIVTGVPQLLIIEAVNVPLLLGSHFELICRLDPRVGITTHIPDPADPWLGLLDPEKVEDMIPYVVELLPVLLQL